MSAGIFSFIARSASRSASSTDRRSMPGMEAIGSRVFVPSQMKSGQIKSSVVSAFSRTNRRDHSALRLRRGRILRSNLYFAALAAFGSGGVKRSTGRSLRLKIDMPDPILLADGGARGGWARKKERRFVARRVDAFPALRLFLL